MALHQRVLFSLFFFTMIPGFASIASNETLINILANHNQYSTEVVEAAFKTLSGSSSKTEPHFISYCKEDEIAIFEEIPSSIYREIVKTMIISCVDVFVYNFEKEAYLMVKRRTPPAEGLWWLPGGRIFKGESFYESAVRKTKNETGINIIPLAQLGTYTTYFTESAWGADVPTDTKNTVVLALCKNEETSLDRYHEDFRWVSIDESPIDRYNLCAYKEAKTKLSELGFSTKTSRGD